MNLFRGLIILLGLIVIPSLALAEKGVVIYKQSGCDYFIADGPNGLYLLEWSGGYDPSRGDVITGKLKSFGFTHVYYPNIGQEGKVYVEDYWLSKDSAIEKWLEHCE